MSDEKIEILFSNLKDVMIEGFNQINKRLDQLEARIDKLEARMDQLEARMDNLEARFDEHEKQQKNDFENLEKRIMQRFDEHEEKQRQDFARLEHVMYERTAALFDAREVSLDEDENLYKKLKSLERVLDKHHYRISDLESKIN